MSVQRVEIQINANDEASSVFDHIAGRLSSLGKIAGGLALGGVAALGAGIIGLGSSGLQLNNSMEKVTAQLNAFTKDGKKTADIIDTVRERAAKTPFEFDQMAKAAVALYPASKTAAGGLNGILEKAEILAASNPAEGLEGAAFALKEAVGGDFTSIIERFNLPRQFINKLKKEGVPDLEIVQRAMKEMGLDVDLVANLANTAEGRWSTFKDTLTGVAAQATKPIFEAMSSGIAGVNGLLEANAPLLTQIGANIAGGLTQAIAAFQQFGALITPVLLGVIDLFTNTEDGGNDLLYALEAITGSKLPDWLIAATFSFYEFQFELRDAFAQIPTIISNAFASFSLIGAQITTAMISIQPALDGILQSVISIFGSLIPIALAQGQGAWTLISTTIQTAITSAIAIVQTWLPVVQTVLNGIALFLTAHGAEIQLLVSTAWTAVTAIIQTAISTVTVVINALAPVVLAIFGQISTFLNAHGSEILGFLTTSWNSISAIVGVAAELVQTVVTRVFGAVAGFIQTHGDTIQRVLTGAWNVISALIGTALDTIKSVISLALAVVNGDWDTAWNEIKNITDTANKAIGVVISTAMDLITSVISSAVSVFQLSWSQGLEAMRTIAIAAWDAIKLAINNAIESAKIVIANGVEAFLGKFRDLRDKMSVIGQQLLEGMVQGIRDKVGWLVDEGVRAANAVLSAIKSTLGINSPSKEAIPFGEGINEGLALGISESINLPIDAGVNMADRTLDRIRVALEPLPEIMGGAITIAGNVAGPAAQNTANVIVNAFSGLADDLEDQILGAAESIVELAESGDSSSLVFAQSFEVLRQTITGIVPSFNDSKNAIARMHETLAAGKFDVQAYWKIYEEMMHNIGRTTTQVMPVVAQTVTTTMQNMGLSTRWFAESFEDQILMSAESFVELAQHGDTSSRVFVAAFENIRQTIGQLVPAFSGGQGAMQAMHTAMASGQFDVENYWKAYDQLLQEIKSSMGISQNVVTSATQAMTNAVVSATQTMQTQASAAAQSIAASMIAAGEVINTTQTQLANFIQSGGIGGITGGTYTPSQAFQDSFRNPPAVAAPRPSSVPKPTVTNNTPINITITGGNVDRYAVEDAVTTALRRSGLAGRLS